ncbi:transposase [Bacillus sp. ISL-40]|uniref:transposase n=1 Tax=unclassified Bacillus (in: firmicutes) TaxID=185979 RepID=UPI001BEA50D1|nr:MULTISPECIES: transposase [unclassified Bacillus (in: firmicutes)]MBT2697543.1 transposase [Bacillus sp. ISL-40]MBT2720907.1 transposase [Bacillus sp. ISL-46]MBT2742247.1 transposase [Bacillus sp. ISL-77]
MEVVFKSEQEKEIKRSEKQLNEWVFEPKRVMGIDLGVDNLATIIDNTGLKPLLIKGKWLKSINQYYNKLRAKYMSILRNGKGPKEGKFHTTRLISIRPKKKQSSHGFFTYGQCKSGRDCSRKNH